MRASLFGFPTTPRSEVDEVFAALDAASRYAGEVQIIGSWTAASPASPSTSKAPVSPIRTPLTKAGTGWRRKSTAWTTTAGYLLRGFDAESAGSLDDVLRVSDSLEAYTFVPNVRSDEELGRYVVVAGQLHGDRRFPEEAWPYLDFAKIGAEYFAGHGGAYTVSGYVMRREDGQQQVQESKPHF
ncbi:MAG: hypothetical protein ACLT3D_01500 [Lawsonibacter sp.]